MYLTQVLDISSNLRRLMQPWAVNVIPFELTSDLHSLFTPQMISPFSTPTATTSPSFVLKA